MPGKVLIVGLDSAVPDLVFNKWRTNLPCLSALMKQGLYGPLTSTIPPITVPAWASMLTSKDPGQLGLYGFRNRKDHSYEDLYIANSTHIKETTLYQLLSRQRLTSILLGVPQTYPPRPLNGIMISSFLTPGKETQYTYPSEMKSELEKAAGGEYIFDVDEFRTEDKNGLLDQIRKMTEARFRAAEYLLTNKNWDFFMMVEMGVDRIQHGFWRYHDPAHRLYEPGNQYEFVIRDYYKDLDTKIGRLMELAPDGTLIMVVSDHGARTMVGGFSINQWLIREGYLTLKETPKATGRLSPSMIDWPRTRIRGEGGYYGRLFFNVAGREPVGQVKPEEYEILRDEIKVRLENEVDHQNKKMGNRVFKPEEIYRAVRNVPPDLIVYFGDLAWRSVGIVGQNQPLYTFENDIGPDDANHAQDGLLILSVKGERGEVRQGFRSGFQIYDVAPTVLDHLGLDIPADMIGRVIK
ncbi:MAG: alkaline phosphatase family protein [Deltaproteobacteria bacterium]|nr:alkaline phosphatase family protein [Deltaproteobacteria bacterium]